MPQVIAGIYELERKIGAGGGGIVYLGRHLRLEKTVVLKADKRTLSTGRETLRREVDMLKELSHTYIPQVYDFVQEDGVVYTVMDFIEGESLDKLLARKQLPSQPQVIRWACQMLEALCYLHSRPPHGILHGDIKPANIMLRASGDICLIDFNIALALGEDGAVKVGFSRGYASPEHYGADYISSHRSGAAGQFSYIRTQEPGRHTGKRANATQTLQQSDFEETKTLAQQDLDVTQTLVQPGQDAARMRSEGGRVAEHAGPSGGQDFASSKDTDGKSKGILLDVRSDIYSLGATLYHLISGIRPDPDAWAVTPLGAQYCSPAVSAILQKAMDPDPSKRYQTAEEMLEAFLQLHKRDKRVIRHKRRAGVSAAVLSAAFLLGGACAFVGLRQMEQMQQALALAEYSANALAQGNVAEAIRQAMQAIPSEESILNAPVTAQAQKALTDALGVYDLSDGFRAFGMLKLPSAPFDLAVSPEGKRLAVVYAYAAAVFDLDTGQELAVLPTQESALSDCVFADEDRIVYAGEKGVTAYDIGTGAELWTGGVATTLAISADRTAVAAVNRGEEELTVYCVEDGSVLTKCLFDGRHMQVAANDIFADARNDILALNADGSMAAVSFADGSLWIYDLKDPEGDLILYEEPDYRHFEGGFYGKYFAFTAEKGGEAVFGMVDTQEAAYLGGYSSQDGFCLQADEEGIYLANQNLLVCVDPQAMEENELAYTENVNITGFAVGKDYVLASTDDNGFCLFDSGANLALTESCAEHCDFVALTDHYVVVGNRNEPSLRLLRLESHDESQLLRYDARYKHKEARISQDGQTAILFDYEGFRIYDMEGKLLAEVKLPEAEQIYDQQFRKESEESFLEVIWYDGTVRCYSASDGTLLSETVREAPSKDLYEEFYTDRYRIASSLHGAPEVYDRQSGRLVAILEPDSYLTYVTQVGEYVITEYISAEGERYGVLLDEKLQKLAYLPELCDVMGDTLVFDYESGNLRQCRLYSLQELMALGEEYLGAVRE